MDRTVYVSQRRNVNNAYGAAMIAAAARRAADRAAAHARAEAELTRRVGDARWITVRFADRDGEHSLDVGRKGAVLILADPTVKVLALWEE